jgi:hypothetical protein
MVTASGEQKGKAWVFNVAANEGITLSLIRRHRQPICGQFGEPGKAKIFGTNMLGRVE